MDVLVLGVFGYDREMQCHDCWPRGEVDGGKTECRPEAVEEGGLGTISGGVDEGGGCATARSEFLEATSYSDWELLLPEDRKGKGCETGCTW